MRLRPDGPRSSNQAVSQHHISYSIPLFSHLAKSPTVIAQGFRGTHRWNYDEADVREGHLCVATSEEKMKNSGFNRMLGVMGKGGTRRVEWINPFLQTRAPSCGQQTTKYFTGWTWERMHNTSKLQLSQQYSVN